MQTVTCLRSIEMQCHEVIYLKRAAVQLERRESATTRAAWRGRNTTLNATLNTANATLNDARNDTRNDTTTGV
jgi:hypothetical protein